MPLLIEGVLRNRKSDLLADFASMRRDGFATDTRVIAVDDGATTTPILVHSLVLAASSPILANLLASSGNNMDGFTIILTGVKRNEVESEICKMYGGQPDFLAHLGLLTTKAQKAIPVKRDLFKEEENVMWSDDEKDMDLFWAQEGLNMEVKDKEEVVKDSEPEPDFEKQDEKCTEENCDKGFASKFY